jgi:hypothetical protein
MKISAMTDTSDLRERMRVWANLVDKETSEGLRQHARVACVELANTTQPFGREKHNKLPGEKAVEVDISKVFYTATPNGGFVNAVTDAASKSFNFRKNSSPNFDASGATEKFRTRLNGYAASGNFTALRKVAKDFLWMGVVDSIDPQIHQQARTQNRKRVKKRAGTMSLFLGPRSELQAYVEIQQKKVGMTKAGWAVCAEKIPVRRASSATRGIPQWVTRNKSRAAASSIVDESEDEDNPRVTMTNAIPWTSECLTDSQTRAALNIARVKFVKYMNIQIKYELKKQAGLK